MLSGFPQTYGVTVESFRIVIPEMRKRKKGFLPFVERQRLLILGKEKTGHLLERLRILWMKQFSMLYKRLGNLSIVVAFQLNLGSVVGRRLG